MDMYLTSVTTTNDSQSSQVFHDHIRFNHSDKSYYVSVDNNDELVFESIVSYF
jgi:hypothetical protein